MSSVFETLNRVNVNGHTEKKNGLTYLSWAWAWAEVKKLYPDATYKVYENANGWFYHTDGRTAWVKTGVTIDGLEHVEMLPVMDFKNRSIPYENVTSTDVNKAIQRSLTKAVARHGLGLYIYAGEDLPEGDDAEPDVEPEPEPVPEPVQISNAKKALKWAQEHGMTAEQFGNWRNAAVDNKFIPDKRVNDLTDDEFASLLRFVEMNCNVGIA